MMTLKEVQNHADKLRMSEPELHGSPITIANPLDLEVFQDKCDFLIEMMGVLPHWANHSIRYCDNNDEMKEMMQHLYTFPIHEMYGGAFTKSGIYMYDGDPDLNPIGATFFRSSIVLYFEHQMISWSIGDSFKSNKWFMTRMD